MMYQISLRVEKVRINCISNKTFTYYDTNGILLQLIKCKKHLSYLKFVPMDKINDY